MNMTFIDDVASAEQHLAETDSAAGVLTKCWQLNMPDAPIPDYGQFFYWANTHRMGVMLASIHRTSRKFRTLDGKMDLDYLRRYTSRCANNASADEQEGE